MRIFVIHPGVAFSTSDVYAGLVGGLRAHGVEMIEGRLDEAITFQAMLYEAGQKHGVVLPGKVNIPYFASPYIAQHAIAVEPDAVIVVSAHNFHITSAGVLQKAGLTTAMVATESPYFAAFERTMAQAYTHVFTHERRCAEGYFDHSSVHYLPHAYNPAVHTPDGPKAAPSDVFFCGSLFEERAKLFGAVDWSGIAFLHRGYAPGRDEQDIIGNEETATHYRAAAINLNHHRTTTDFGSGVHITPGSAESLGPRAYEVAACGAFQLCDDSRPELHELFQGSVPTYRAGDSRSLEREVRHWLRCPGAREDMARAACDAVQPHSWTGRARQILEVLT